MPEVDPELRDRLTRDHRALDDLFGRFLGAAAAADVDAALEAIASFDDELRRHTAVEEDSGILGAAGKKLLPDDAADAAARLHRELRVEHVQVRELSAMIRRTLEEKRDLEGARRLAGNLARRWDAHTTREERELFSAPSP
jgi:hypothetical protein